MIERKKIIGVMGSHEDPWTGFARPLGELIARRGYHLLTGTGAGIMIQVAKGFMNVPGRAGQVIGITPSTDGKKPHEADIHNPYVDMRIVTPLDSRARGDAMPFSRNMVNIMTSDALILLPGGHGTKNEAALGLVHEKPVILFGPDGAFDNFPDDTLYTDELKVVEHFLTDLFGVPVE